VVSGSRSAYGGGVGIAWKLGIGAAIVVALVGPVAIELAIVGPARDRVEAVRALPLHRGRLHGPSDRVTPNGHPAAAYWWSVDSTDDESHETYCGGRARDRLALDTTRIAWSDADPDDVGLVSDDRSDEHGRRFMIDLGARAGELTSAVPRGTCTGTDARYGELRIDDGAEVDVVGCIGDGVVLPCAGPIGGVIAVDGLEAYVAHARARATRPRWIGLVVAASLLVAAIGGAVTRRSRSS